MSNDFNFLARIQVVQKQKPASYSIILLSNTSSIALQELLQKKFKVQIIVTFLTYFDIEINDGSYAWTDEGLCSRNRVFHYITNKNKKIKRTFL